MIISADNARKIAKNKLNEGLTSELKSIMELIKTSCEEGKFEIYLPDRTLEQDTKVMLETAGYKIEVGGRYNEVNTRITW